MSHTEGVSGCMVGGSGHSTSHNPGIQITTLATLTIYFHTFKRGKKLVCVQKPFLLTCSTDSVHVQYKQTWALHMWENCQDH